MNIRVEKSPAYFFIYHSSFIISSTDLSLPHSSFLIHNSSFLLLVAPPRKCLPASARKVLVNAKAGGRCNNQEDQPDARRTQEELADPKHRHINHQAAEQPIHQIIHDIV